MRRLLGAGLLALTLVATACGGGDDDNKVGDATADGAGALSKLAAGSVAADVCGGREAVNIGVAFASAMSKVGEVDYDDVAKALTKAADAAPTEIKDDFRVIAAAEGPFLKILGEADLANYQSLMQNPEYLAALQALGAEKVQAAQTTINAWFAEHCD